MGKVVEATIGEPEALVRKARKIAERERTVAKVTSDAFLQDAHARYHVEPGNLLGRDECGWSGCEFWDAAEFALRLAVTQFAGSETQGEPSGAQIEAAARVIYEDERRSVDGGGMWPAWDDCRPAGRERVLECARSALRAAQEAKR